MKKNKRKEESATVVNEAAEAEKEAARAEEEIAVADAAEDGKSDEPEKEGSCECECECKEGESAEEEVKEAEPTPLEKAEALAEDYKRKWYTVTAEYENYRKRNAAAVSKAYADGVAEAVLKLLPVSDTFGYALSSAADKKTRDGIEKVIKNFNSILSSFGIEEIKISEGDEFDETVAEAILSLPCGEKEKPNRIKNVLKKGYRQGDKVIRFAQVAVTVKD